MLNRPQRTPYLVLAVTLGHIILISAQVETNRGSSVLRAVSFGTLVEAQRVVTSGVERIRNLWSGYVSLRGAHEENVALRETVAALELQLQKQHALVQRTRNLQALLELRDATDVLTLGAQVIATDATPWFRTVTIDRGTRDGVRSDLAVIAPRGVVGRVVGFPGPRAARVQLLIDRNAAAGALIERTRASGVVVGSGDVSELRLDYVSNLRDVRVGDTVVTSGTDGIYPKGYTIGAVSAVSLGPGLYKSITLTPRVAFGNLEEVLVVMTDERLAQAEGVE